MLAVIAYGCCFPAGYVALVYVAWVCFWFAFFVLDY